MEGFELKIERQPMCGNGDGYAHVYLDGHKVGEAREDRWSGRWTFGPDTGRWEEDGVPRRLRLGTFNARSLPGLVRRLVDEWARRRGA